MLNDPREAAADGDSSLFLTEAAARLRIAVRMIKRSQESPDEWGGESGFEYAVEVAHELIEEVAGELEAYNAACEATDKAGV